MLKRELIAILLFGSIWGLLEVSGGGALYGANVPYSGVIISITAFAILGISYVFISKPGSFTLIAATACLFRFANAGPHYCHLLAIFSLGLGFDIVARMIRKEKPLWLSGALGTWIGYAIFALLITYVFRYHYWTAEGFPKVIRYIGINGSMAALGASITTLLGYNIGKTLKKASGKRKRLAYGLEIGIICMLWAFVRFL